ncbi:MAG: hypothetical protein A2161_00220 [Candidatus Schekmanbacteria bacterium RBG_13_48_7]|uniref:Nucleotidyl transferase AbiEii/AbiGii toxin family protein n=1 Tax=Candidatus Schekmanbacteria bacterium RBG_13_48_7 TaxID=1817878 RepID=A0A1F7S542_9BACT|nr:MAG: hypothetical protein A2161_00220 [Candidatus Schekmanbacteria bacterium RBG_13_48_7]
MKQYDQVYIRESEVMQVIILHNLYSLKESNDIFFQGGTAIRLCYNGRRFSEDLDFVSHLTSDKIALLLKSITGQVRNGLVAHYGRGELELTEKGRSRESMYSAFFRFQPEGSQRKISVKLEFEGLRENSKPLINRMILYMLPVVRQMLVSGEFVMPNLSSIIMVQTPEEILSDKIRAIFERTYLKGRDFYDIWYLSSIFNIKCDPQLVMKKIEMYRTTFRSLRSPVFFLKPGKNDKGVIIDAINQDLERFLPAQELEIFSQDRFKAFFNSLKNVVLHVQDIEQFKQSRR